jgi:hypothetical protein
MNVLFTPEVEDYLFNLVEILFKKQYFAYYENAEKYVIDLITQINNYIHIRSKHIAPPRFRKYGRDLYYVTFKSSKRITWYVFLLYMVPKRIIILSATLLTTMFQRSISKD